VRGERPPAADVLERLRALDPLAAETIQPCRSPNGRVGAVNAGFGLSSP